MVLDNVKNLIDIIKEVDSRLGFKKLVIYTIYIFIILVIYNWKSSLTWLNDQLDLINESKHTELLKIRSRIEVETFDNLRDILDRTGSNRVLLFEFHNTKHNLIGLPFRFMTMTQVCSSYGTKSIHPLDKYNSINTGLISNFIIELSNNSNIYIDNLTEFQNNYPLVGGLLKTDGAKFASFHYLPGVPNENPVGLVIIEWIDNDSSPNWKMVHSNIIKPINNINLLISNKKLS